MTVYQAAYPFDGKMLQRYATAVVNSFPITTKRIRRSDAKMAKWRASVERRRVTLIKEHVELLNTLFDRRKSLKESGGAHYATAHAYVKSLSMAVDYLT